MSRVQVATDNFNRADESAATGWEQLNTFWGNISVVTNQAYGTGSGAIGSGVGPAARWSGVGTFTDDQYSKVEIQGLSFLSNAYWEGVLVRASGDVHSSSTPDPRDYYGAIVEFDGSTNKTTRLFKISNGVYTSLATSPEPWANGDTIALEVTGSATADLKVYRNDVLITALNYSDSSSPLTTGKPGIAITGSSDGPRIDNWEGGNLTGGTSQALAGAATGSGQAAAAASIAKNMAAGAAGAGLASGNLGVTSGLVFRTTLVDYVTGNPVANWIGLRWTWWPSIADWIAGSNGQGGTGQSTDANGLFEVPATGALTPGLDQGIFFITDFDGSNAPTALWVAGQFDIVSL